jgi:hypothetical protein
MDERLQKALDFSNYTLTINNQKRNIKNRVAMLQVVHYNSGVFIANHDTISFFKSLIDLGHDKQLVVMDSKENPIKIVNLTELLEKLVSAYFNAMNEYDSEYEKLRKARSIKQIMDW